MRWYYIIENGDANIRVMEDVMPYLKVAPQLAFDANKNRWILHLNENPRSVSYAAEIRYAWNGKSWTEYKFLAFDMGDEYECVTRDQGEDARRVAMIYDNDMEAWDERYWRGKLLVHPHHAVFKLKDHFEAILNLGLISLSVNHG